VNHYTFPIASSSIDALLVSQQTTTRMKALVYKAQRDFQFATIYEQRRTNQILVAGFASFGSTLAGLAAKIAQSLYDVRESIEAVGTRVAAAVAEAGEGVVEAVSLTSDRVTEQNEASGEQRSEEAAELRFRALPGVQAAELVRYGIGIRGRPTPPVVEAFS
jgi:hypothetical protein